MLARLMLRLWNRQMFPILLEAVIIGTLFGLVAGYVKFVTLLQVHPELRAYA